MKTNLLSLDDNIVYKHDYGNVKNVLIIGISILIQLNCVFPGCFWGGFDFPNIYVFWSAESETEVWQQNVARNRKRQKG